MPELPEVETVRRAMQQHLVGCEIAAVTTSDKRLREPLPRKRLSALKGDRFTAAQRRAKYLLLTLASEKTLLIHLGMSGNLLLRPGGEKHDHVVFELTDGATLVFSDPRRFGLVLVLTAAELQTCPYLTRLGVEPLSPTFDADYLHACCGKSTRPIKNLIMDGNLVVGMGNIYASEALFKAGIRPTAAAGKISKPRLARLVDAIKQILRAAIRQGGTTISDYRGSGSGGLFQQRLAVYGRTGAPCQVCQKPVQSLTLAGRNTFFCTSCQK